LIKSTLAGTQSTLILQNGARCNLGYVNATDINSSGGRTIQSFNGVLSNTINWNVFNDINTISYTNQN